MLVSVIQKWKTTFGAVTAFKRAPLLSEEKYPIIKRKMNKGEQFQFSFANYISYLTLVVLDVCGCEGTICQICKPTNVHEEKPIEVWNAF